MCTDTVLSPEEETVWNHHLSGVKEFTLVGHFLRSLPVQIIKNGVLDLIWV